MRFEVETVIAGAALSDLGSTGTLQATGHVATRRRATVFAQVKGTPSEALFEEGEHIEAGQVLTRLENAAQNASLTQARAQFSAAQVLLNQYEVQLAPARCDLNRNEELAVHQLVSQ